jgi:hypothetical protein
MHKALQVKWLASLQALLLCGSCVVATVASASTASSLREQHAQLQARLARNDYQRPLVIESTERSGELQGEVYAVLQQPFSRVASELSSADNWCDVMMLPQNVKGCQAAAEQLQVRIGRKHDQPLKDAHAVDFAYRVTARDTAFLQVQLDAEEGPVGTRDYRIVLEAIPLDAKRSFIRLSYSYGYGLAAKVAMQGYLATKGSDKVGFTVTGRAKDGSPQYVGNVRGVIERNTMRYFLAIEAYLGSLDVPESQQTEKRLHDWFAATEQYPRQLHEIEQAEYLAMKRKELQRQQTMASAK